MVINLYSVIEISLKRICDSARDLNRIKLKVSDLGGQGTHKAMCYLEKVLGVSFSNEDKKIIRDLNLIRNVIAHWNGQRYNLKNVQWLKQLEDLANADNRIAFDENELRLTYEYVDSLFDITRDFFNNLFKSLNYTINAEG